MADTYPIDPCPFCTIASAYPLPTSPLWEAETQALRRCVPDEEEGKEEGKEEGRTDPESFVVLKSPGVLAFLDIMPMTRGEFMLGV
jgi:hypothetical protein